MSDLFLDELSVMNGFSAEEIDRLRPLFQPVCAQSGDILFGQGDPATQFYIVTEGEVLIQYKPEDGPALILTRVRKEGVVGWSAAIGSPAYTSSAMCAVDSELLCIRSEDLHRFYEEQPVLAQQLMERLSRVIAERLRHTHPQIMALLENGLRLNSIRTSTP